MLSKATIEELRTLVKSDYGADLSQSEAIQLSSSLLGFFEELNSIDNENEKTIDDIRRD